MVSIRKMGLTLAASLGATLFMAVTAQAQLNVNIYAGHSTSGGGAPFSGLVGSFSSPQIDFASSTGYNWHPFGLGAFGADITGCLMIPQTGDYTFALNSDDGSLLYIDGNLVIDNGGPHGPNVVPGTATLTAGSHSVEVQFFEDFGGPSGVDLNFVSGGQLSLVPANFFVCEKVPEPGAVATLVGMALSGAGFLSRRLRRR